MRSTLLLLLASLLLPQAPGMPGQGARGAAAAARALAPELDPRTGRWPAPTTTWPVEQVIDGDTLWIRRHGAIEKLRLSSVDTEEQLLGNPLASSTKPETVFGEECARWARDLFAGLAPGGGTPRVGLVFPGGTERHDVYGRLLCHVVLPDGTDFNLLLVREGKSPYFVKYGNSRVCHAAFVAAQRAARARRKGIWDPGTNRPRTPGAPAARRPYERLLPWWRARADAIERFRARAAEDPGHWVAADEPEALEAACARGERVHVLALVERLFGEDDGSLTVLLRSGERSRALRATVPAARREAFLAAVDPGATVARFRQNYVYVTGVITRGRRGFEVAAGDPAQWRVADPEYDAR